MEDIKMIKEKLSIIENLCTDDCINKATVIQPLKYAIENLIARNKELEKQMGKDLDVVYLQGVYNERDRWKSKVREKIEEANKEIKQMEQDDIGIGFTLGNRWSDLKAKVKGWKELLQEGDK